MFHQNLLRCALPVLLAGITFFSACKKDKDTGITVSGGYRKVYTSSDDEQVAYYIFNANKTVTVLTQTATGGRKTNTYNYRVDDNVMFLSVFSTKLYTMRTAGDTLKLLDDPNLPESSNNNIILVKDNNTPTPDNWITPITISGRIIRNNVNLTAMAWISGELWTTFFGDLNFRKFNATTAAESASVPTTARYYGLDMAGGSLWAADYNTGDLKKLNPTTGAVTFSPPAPPQDVYTLAADASNVYCMNVNNDRLMIYNIAANTFSQPVQTESSVRDLAYKNGHLYMLAFNVIYKFEIASLSVVKTYRFTDIDGCSGLTTDGSSFYAYVSDGINAPGYFAKFNLD